MGQLAAASQAGIIKHVACGSPSGIRPTALVAWALGSLVGSAAVWPTPPIEPGPTCPPRLAFCLRLAGLRTILILYFAFCVSSRKITRLPLVQLLSPRSPLARAANPVTDPRPLASNRVRLLVQASMQLMQARLAESKTMSKTDRQAGHRQGARPRPTTHNTAAHHARE